MSATLTAPRGQSTRLGHSAWLRLGLLCTGVAFAVATLALERSHALGSFAGRSISADVIEGTAAVGLLVTGVISWDGGASGPLLVLAGFAWLLPEWTNPQAELAPLFTLGLAGLGATAALMTHLGLAHPGSSLATRRERLLVLGAYLATLVGLGLLPLVVFDPQAQGCLSCPTNLVLVHGDAGVYADASRWGIRAAIVALALAVAAIALRLARLSPAKRRAFGPLLAAVIAFIAFFEADLWHSASRGLLSNDGTDVFLWKAQGICLVLVAASVLHDVARARRTQIAMAALVVELARAPRVGGAGESLAATLGDPHLRLLYRRDAGPAYVDVSGMPAEANVAPGRALTRLMREREEIAVMEHSADLLAEPRRVQAAIAAARLAVENERLQAELRAQARELRESRRRIVEEGDNERRRLERDLHDGAQQRLVALSLALQLLRGQTTTAASRTRIDDAEQSLRAALAELREVAHGIYPSALAAEGFAAAMEDLTEHVDGRVRIESLPDSRLDLDVEQAAYFAVSEILRDLAAGEWALVRSTRTERTLQLGVDCSAAPESLQARLVAIDDRVGALGGTLTEMPGPNGTINLQVRIPCAS